MAENGQTAMDSLIAENERKLAKWKREEQYTDLGTYLVHLIRSMMPEQPPKVGEYNMARDIEMQKKFLQQFPRYSTTQQDSLK